MFYSASLFLFTFLLYTNFFYTLIVFGILSVIVILVNLAWLTYLNVKRLMKLGNRRLSPSKQVILITGCDTGLGWKTAQLLNEKGYRVLACCLFPEGDGARKLLQEAKNPDRLEIIELDITKADQVDATVSIVLKRLKQTNEMLTGLINNAGVNRSVIAEGGNFDEVFKFVTDVNLLGPIRVTRAFLPLIRASQGRIIFLSSMASLLPIPYGSPYCMTKAGIQSFAESLAWEVQQFGVKVITILPCFASTQMLDLNANIKLGQRLWNDSSEEVRKAYGLATLESTMSFFGKVFEPFWCVDYVTKEVPKTIVSALENPEPSFRNIVAPYHLKILINIPRLFCHAICVVLHNLFCDYI